MLAGIRVALGITDIEPLSPPLWAIKKRRAAPCALARHRRRAQCALGVGTRIIGDLAAAADGFREIGVEMGGILRIAQWVRLLQALRLVTPDRRSRSGAKCSTTARQIDADLRGPPWRAPIVPGAVAIKAKNKVRNRTSGRKSTPAPDRGAGAVRVLSRDSAANSAVSPTRKLLGF